MRYSLSAIFPKTLPEVKAGVEGERVADSMPENQLMNVSKACYRDFWVWRSGTSTCLDGSSTDAGR
jgi:hypothetical protein